jgi:hypothetical protein
MVDSSERRPCGLPELIPRGDHRNSGADADIDALGPLGGATMCFCTVRRAGLPLFIVDAHIQRDAIAIDHPLAARRPRQPR